MMESRDFLPRSVHRTALISPKRRFSVFFLWVFILLGFSARADASSVPELEARFLELTQALRSQPAKVLAALFPESSFPLQASPLFQTLAAHGMPRFVLNDALTRTAEDTLRALVAQAESGAASYEIPPLSDRLGAHGYAAVETGEILTALTFRNFVQPEAAADALFRDVLAKELSTLDLRRTVLLNPHVREVGLSCRAAKITVNGMTQNAYVLVMETGAHVLHALELQLFKELNRWRQNPGNGLFPMFLSILTGNTGPWDVPPVPVLVWDSRLYEAARSLGMGTQLPEGAVRQPTESELSGWVPLWPELRASVPLDVSMGLDHLTAAIWQALLAEEARRWVSQAGSYALSSSAFGGAVHLVLRTAEDGSLFLEAVLLTATPSDIGKLQSRLAGSVVLAGFAEGLSGTVQEVRLVSAASQEIKASALVDTSGGFSFSTEEPLYPPFSPYDLVVLDGAGREMARQPLPLGLDGAFVEVVSSLE